MNLDDQGEAENVSTQGRALLALDFAENPEVFLDSLDQYLKAFASWEQLAMSPEYREKLRRLSPTEARALRSKLETLSSIHTQVIQLAERCRETLRGELGELHRRGKALRSYIDRYPSRVNITGKREM